MSRPEKAIKGRPGIHGLGERLSCVRQMRSLTQAELAQKTKQKASFISHVECGRRVPGSKNLRDLCVALNCSADYLLDSE